jgi:hypothetical protein
MKQELELKLVGKYPKILKDYGGDKMQTCMAWGMEVGEGWYDLLDTSMARIQYLCDLFTKDNDKEVQLIANQIKEKFGTLRFYYSIIGATDLQCDILSCIISQAERISEQTCEITGKHGHTCVSCGWYKVLCYEEARKLGYVALEDATEEYWKTMDTKDNTSDENTEEN